MGTPGIPSINKSYFKNLSNDNPGPQNARPPDQSTQGDTEGLIFTFDDVDDGDKEPPVEKVQEEMTQQPATPQSAFSCRPGSDVFLAESRSLPQMRDKLPRKCRRSFKAQLSAIDIIMPVGSQRHTNFTPPRLSPQLSREYEDDLSVFKCSVHTRRSSACLLVHKCGAEKEVGLNLRSVSDHFNIQLVGLADGYHLQCHPHSSYHKPYSSSYPGAPSAPVVKRDSLQGVKVRKSSSAALRSPCDVQ